MMIAFRVPKLAAHLLLAAIVMGCSDSPVDRAACGSDAPDGSSTEYFGTPLTPAVYLINFLFLYMARPEDAANMPAYKAPLPSEVVACLEQNPAGCPWAEYAQYFDVQGTSGAGTTRCECEWAVSCQLPAYEGLSAPRYETPGQINQPLGVARAEEMARSLGVDAGMILTDEEYQCVIGAPPRTKDQTTIVECVADLTNSIGNANIPLSSYGLDISPEGDLRSNCAPDAPCLEFNDLLAGPLEKMFFDCGAEEKFLALVSRTPFLDFAGYGNDCQTSSEPACLVQAQCRRSS